MRSSHTVGDSQQFAQRLSNDLAAIGEAGLEIIINELRSRGRTYGIPRSQ